MDVSKLQKLSDWLMGGARSAPAPTAVLKEVCDRVVEAGIPLSRVGVFVQALHPDVFGRAFFWRPGPAAAKTQRPCRLDGLET